MARNKRGLEMAAGYKTKEDIRLAKTTGAYEVELTKGISESSSELETPEKVSKRALIRIAKAIRRAARKRHMMNKKGAISVEIPNKLYDVLIQYHQLNYPMVQEAVKTNGFKCTVMTNTHLWIHGVDEETLKKIKEAFIKCHFKTKQGKEYKVRVAAYRSHLQTRPKKEEKKPTNNTKQAKESATAKRKANNIANAKAKAGHKTRRAEAGKLPSQNKGNHKPAVRDTSNVKKRATINVKKAIELIERQKKNSALQAKYRASKGVSQPKSRKKDKQLKIAA